ncbi:hypothetical protein M422DRAFT_253664 [Sphaerobolus stellatus SS14]|uniref:Uncharacterized protein n=1 Tax=Sphaerobolus stellatus (strain SS14) TaxID=990650 RepID=A0A0C9UJA6_SPHS4|nr:hypothetical protein M422DRAFT_253664 [Sphaerobolus stellatus SS14]
MSLIATSLCFVLLFFTASARPSMRDSCGANAQVISEKTLTHGNKEIKFVITSCPGFAALRNTTTNPSTVRKRQISQCTDTCTAFECNTTVVQPVVTDCEELSDLLIGLSQIFAVPPQTMVHVTDGTCFYHYANLDTITYDVCSSGWGQLGQDVVNHCFTILDPVATFTAGLCLSPGISGDNFIVDSHWEVIPHLKCHLEDDFYATRVRQRRHNIELRDDIEFDNPSSDKESDSSMSSLSSLSPLSSASSIANVSSHIKLGDGMDWAGDGMVFDEDNEEEEERHSQKMQAIRRHLNFIMTNCVLEPNTIHKPSQLHLILVLYEDDDQMGRQLIFL